MKLPHPRRTAQTLLVALAAGVCDQTYWQYSSVDHYWPTHWMPYIHGTGLAPEQYRLGVKLAAWWLVRHLHWGFRYGFTLFDIAGLTAALLLTYDLLERRPAVHNASLTIQWFAAAIVFGLAAYYLMWVGFFFRPETLPSVGLTAVMAWLWTVRHESRPGRHAAIAGGLILASAAQSWIRADIPCTLNAGFFVVSLTRFGKDLSLPKRLATATSLFCIAVATGTQLYIMRVLYPHATYGTTPVLMVLHDLRHPLQLPPFLVFMLPVGWTALQAWKHRNRLPGSSIGLLLGAGLYLALWIVMGKIDEVRIFIPFALVLAPLTAELALRRLAGDSPPSITQPAQGEAVR